MSSQCCRNSCWQSLSYSKTATSPLCSRSHLLHTALGLVWKLCMEMLLSIISSCDMQVFTSEHWMVRIYKVLDT